MAALAPLSEPAPALQPRDPALPSVPAEKRDGAAAQSAADRAGA
jgi:hypothetical protein